MKRRNQKQQTRLNGRHLNGSSTITPAPSPNPKSEIRDPQFRAQSSTALGGWAGSAFEAAKRTGFRGYFWFPGLEPSAQMPQMTREVIAEKSNWLYNNFPAVAAVIDGLSLDEVETGIWPRAASSNPDFNKLATDRFDESWRDPRFFDTARHENAYSSQYLIRRTIRQHGELFAQMLSPGPDFNGARFHFIPAWQIRNANTPLDQSRWTEGQQFDRLGACTAYRVVTNKEGTAWQDVPASDLLHFHDPFWVRQKRGMPALHSVVRKLFTCDEVEKAMANGIQLRTFMAYAITKKEGDTMGPTAIPGSTGTETETNANGETITITRIEAPNGNEITVAEPPPGRDIKVIESNASNEPLGFKRDVLTDLAYSQKYPPDYVFALAGGSLGTEVRWKVRRVQNVKNSVRWFQLIPQFLEPAFRFKTWQDIKAGLYDNVPGGIPADWWRYDAICPADTSVDLGREGKLYDDRLAKGTMDPNDHAGLQGKYIEDIEDSVIRTHDRRTRKLAVTNKEREKAGLEPLTYEQCWPTNLNSQPVAPNTGSNQQPPPGDNPGEAEE